MDPEQLEEYRKKRALEKAAGGGKKRDPSKWAHEKLGDDDSDDGGGGAWTGKTGNVDEEDLRDLYEEKAELQEQTRDDINAQAQLTEVRGEARGSTFARTRCPGHIRWRPRRPLQSPPPPSISSIPPIPSHPRHPSNSLDLPVYALVFATTDQGEADSRHRKAP